uniref:TEP1-F n=1 Tax=Glossina morsitans morsitans TaxID=37546 RepID=A0A1B0G6L1_GLOMM
MLKACFIVCLLQIFARTRAEGKYSVIGPGTIHSDGKYTVAVAVHHVAEPCQIQVGLTGPSYNDSKIVELSGFEVKNVDFDLPVLERGDYNLTAEGLNCMKMFKNSTKLNYSKFHTNVRVQTDKGLYKPGDVINYRVIFLDKNLRPDKPIKEAKIYVEDGKRNRIKEIKDFNVVQGVYTGKFQISEYPVTGGWRLGVSNGGRYDHMVYFDVDKYVLPKYVVKVESTERVSVKDGDMQVIVRANYTYGKPLNGKVTLLVNLNVNRYYYRGDSETEETPKNPPTIIKTAPMIQGKSKIDLDVKEYEAFMDSKTSPSYLSIVATVEEEFTGVKINATSGSTVYPYRYSMNCISYDTCSVFQADKEAEVEFQIVYVDGTHLNDTKSPVELIYTEVLNKYRVWYPDSDEENSKEADTEPVSENRTFHFRSHMNESSIAVFKVSLPDLRDYRKHAHFYKMELKYRDEQRELYSTYQYREPKNLDPLSAEENDKLKEFFQLEYKRYDDKIEINKESQFTVNSSQPLSYVVYNVVGRGNILKSDRIDLPDKPKFHNISLTPTEMWAPNFALYVYYVDEKGEYHYAEQRYYVQYRLQNQINITAPEQVKPGENVSLKIKTAPNSFVGLTAVDQSVLLLRSNNDLRPHEFDWVLSSYTTTTPHQGGYSDYPGWSSGVVTLTNADYFYNWTKPEYLSTPLSAQLDSELNNRIFTKSGVQESGILGAAGRPAMAEADSGSGFSASSAEVQVRKDFSETWLFDNIESTNEEEFTYVTKIPDTITSWLISGFSMNPNKGLGITADKTKVVTFQPFFISIRLPYSVKRGEVINVPALVFNYLNKDLDVEVILDNNDGEYEFMDITNEVHNDEKQVKKVVRVPAHGAAGVSFMLRPKIIGNVMLKYLAKSPLAGDAIHKTMKVVPEGVTQYANRAYFVNLKKESEEKTNFKLELPDDVVPDSQYVEVGVMGDLLGPVLNNLDNLVRKPAGCAEQTMSKLLPNYLVMKYMQHINQLTPGLEKRLLYNIESGYQNMLNFRLKDGSFSAFGLPQYYRDEKKPTNGSTWLTAYIIRSFNQLKEFVNIDERVINEGLEYMVKNQAKNGSFIDKGNFYYGGSRDVISLTSTVLLAFLENKTIADQHKDVIQKGLDFISKNIDKPKTLKDHILGTYTLHKAQHPQAEEELIKIKNLAKTEGDRMWWSESDDRPKTYYFFSNDVEITAYNLLTLLDESSTTVDDVLPIIKWLIAQRNSYGGFSSTQDTIVGLQAIIKFAEKADYKAAKMDIEIEAKGDMPKKETLHLNEENGILYQTLELPAKTSNIEFTVKGAGSALVQISYQYNIFEKAPQPSFSIDTQKHDSSLSGKLLMDVCVDYIGEGDSSNMALLEISLPSGFVIDEDSLENLKQIEGASNIEVKNSASLLVIYFDHLHKNRQKCVPIEAFKSHAVAMQKPASILLYDYYDTNKKVTSFYEVASKLCDICDGEEECSKCT